MSHHSILRIGNFWVDGDVQVVESSNEWIAARIHHPLAAIADLVAADVFAGRIDLNGYAPSHFTQVRIGMSNARSGVYTWNACLCLAPKSPFWMPLEDRGLFKKPIRPHLERASEIAALEIAKPRVELEYSAWIRDLSNHQLLALRQVEKSARDTPAAQQEVTS
jgi:hypothetical protein